MTVRYVKPEEIRQIAIEDLLQPRSQVITNTELSEELKKELSADLSSDYIQTFIRIKINDEWHKYTNKKDKDGFVGLDEATGAPIYKSTWNGEDWLYLPFTHTLDALKSSGELGGGNLQIQNVSEEIAELIHSTPTAIPVKIYTVSKNTGICILADEYKYLTSIVNMGVIIQATTMPADVLSSRCPSNTYSKDQFKG